VPSQTGAVSENQGYLVNTVRTDGKKKERRREDLASEYFDYEKFFNF